MTEREAISANIEARKAVQLLSDFIPDILKDYRKVDETRFFTILAEFAAARVGKVVRSPAKEEEPMDHFEACTFEQTVVPYGKYAGKRISEVPPGYWIYLHEGDFPKHLRRYLTSQTFQDRQ